MRRAVVVVVTAVSLYSAWHSGGGVWGFLREDQRVYAAYSEDERAHAVMLRLPLTGAPFDFFRDHLVRGDRIFFQVGPGGFGPFLDRPQIVAAVGRYYLLPGVQVSDVRDATVVVTWEADPASLGLHFVTQSQDGSSRSTCRG